MEVRDVRLWGVARKGLSEEAGEEESTHSKSQVKSKSVSKCKGTEARERNEY